MSTTSHIDADGRYPSKGIVSIWMALAVISASGFALYALSLPFTATSVMPHALIGALAVLGLVVSGLAATSPNGMFCPWLNIGIGVIIATPFFGILAYATPGLFTICITMFLATLSAIIWSLSFMSAFTCVKKTEGV